MITERISFQAKYGRGDELVALMSEWTARPDVRTGLRGARLYTDLTGAMFTVVLETDYDDLDAYTAYTKREMGDYSSAEFQDWFGKMVPLVETGSRQLLNSRSLL